MRKTITPSSSAETETEQGWLDLAKLAHVELSSEDPANPIEDALQARSGSGWRAADPGEQFIRLLFDDPITVRKIQLRIDEQERPRSQEFVLRYSQDQGKTYREIVRQQYNFHPPGAATEQEEYAVELPGVTALELSIKPEIGGGSAKASVSRLRVG
jgi:hypothetical protein